MENDLGSVLAAVNATFNGLSGICLFCGYLAIRRGDRQTHKKWMISAFALSVLFLVSYLTRFSLTGVHRYPGVGPIKTFYLALLGSHTLLAVMTPILALRTLTLALKGRFEAHRKIARITFPIWMYVCVTGVLVYFMLYRFVY